MANYQGQVLNDSYAHVYTVSPHGKKIFLYPLCVGHSHLLHYSISRVQFDSFLIMLVKEGTLFLQLEGRDYLARPGDVVLLDCYRPHCYGSRGECRMDWLHFDGPLARDYFEIAAQSGLILHPANLPRFSMTLSGILALFDKKVRPREEILSCQIISLMTQLMEVSDSSEQEDAVDLAVQLITDDPAAPHTLDSLASAAAISPFYLCHRFKEKMGLSPHAYLLQVRMDRARYLLKFTDQPLKAVAENCGFSNPSSFSNSFRQHTGTTPLAYRRGSLP